MERSVSDSSAISASRLSKIGTVFRTRISSKKERGEKHRGEKPQPKIPIDIPPVQKFVQELDATDTVATDSHVFEISALQELYDSIRNLHAASLGVHGVDFTYNIYANCRERCLELCRRLAHTSQSHTPRTPRDSNSFLEYDASYEPLPVNAEWILAIQLFKTCQKSLLEDLRLSITSTYLAYERSAPLDRVQLLFTDKTFESMAIARMRSADVPLMRSDTPDFWQKYTIRLRNHETLRNDIQEIEKLHDLVQSRRPTAKVQEFDIAPRGDAILEFSNSRYLTPESRSTEDPQINSRSPALAPILRFRVSSHMLMEASPFFARIFRQTVSEPTTPLNGSLIPASIEYPPSPLKQTDRDGTEIRVYRMPQIELNKSESLSTLLHAAHMHNDKIPRQVRFQEFIDIAEVCLRYQCTSPLEMAVEYRWLPQWIHRASDAAPDGLLLMSYVFGLRGLFTRTSKTAILNICDDQELQMKDIWPQEVKDKIRAVMHAKFSQIYTTCRSFIEEYCRSPLRDGPGANGFTTMPRCSKGSHQCDATNLGWLMLFFNDLGILPILNGDANHVPPRRSIKELLTSLRRMPTAPQLHGGTCDIGPTFRNAINDITNSISGLTLWDVSGKHGWALSTCRENDMIAQNESGIEIFELAAPTKDALHPAAKISANDNVALRVMGYLDDLADLQSAAMINKEFYHTYKKNELDLTRKVAKKQRFIAEQGEMGLSSPISRSQPMTPTLSESASLPPINTNIDLSGSSTPISPVESPLEPPLSPEEVADILWPRSHTESSVSISNKLDPEINMKFLATDVVHGDKTLVVEGKKHLREEYDRTIGTERTVSVTS